MEMKGWWVIGEYHFRKLRVYVCTGMKGWWGLEGTLGSYAYMYVCVYGNKGFFFIIMIIDNNLDNYNL